ncbi:MAG TPA: ABC transporter ATP-binding protein [Bryobacteraceae bacterium]|nr:ABC transporter ATP-binding protein [Bryobacteraceae bacterium]
MISCRHLTRKFGDFTAVDSISLDVEAGTICAVLGPNGAGKSTTVGMLTGLLPPSSGEAIVCGVNVARDPVAVKRKIGVLPEDLGLFDDLTIEEHLEMTGDLYGLDAATTRARIERLLATLGLVKGRRTFARACSHGMRKKTAFAMALLPNPEALFLDEPFEAVDPVTSASMAGILRDAASRGVTVFLTSHILPMAARIADRFVIIRAGRIALNLDAHALDRPLEELYFELAEAQVPDRLEWLGQTE